MNSMIFVLYCVPVILGLIIQGWLLKEKNGVETKTHLLFFLSIWIPGVNILVVTYSLLLKFVVMSLKKAFGVKEEK